MNPGSKPRYEPVSPMLRTLFAAVAIAATVSTGAFIDALADGGVGAPTTYTTPVVIAQI